MLKVEALQSGYGRIQALHGIDLEVAPGEIVALVGANGAGKTTLLMTICGNPRAGAGRVLLGGEDVTRLATHHIIRRGLAHCPEGRRIFARMSVLENLQMGAATTAPTHFRQDLDRVLELFPRLQERLNQRGGTLSGGEQQMLAIGRALMSRPKVLLLDEPSLGLAPLVVRHIFEIIAAINRDQGVTIFLVEQNAYHALKLAHRGYVMVNGKVTMTGSGTDLLANPEIRAHYLDGGAG
ncbi:MAG: ABC transporter ATP-binding protein [Magnetospirillum sp.]|nr:MAG: ABC transporter ATP-binding protein [Magnetospirillum sp.]